jgi:hypothetical protein
MQLKAAHSRSAGQRSNAARFTWLHWGHSQAMTQPQPHNVAVNSSRTTAGRRRNTLAAHEGTHDASCAQSAVLHRRRPARHQAVRLLLRLSLIKPRTLLPCTLPPRSTLLLPPLSSGSSTLHGLVRRGASGARADPVAHAQLQAALRDAAAALDLDDLVVRRIPVCASVLRPRACRQAGVVWAQTAATHAGPPRTHRRGLVLHTPSARLHAPTSARPRPGAGIVR